MKAQVFFRRYSRAYGTGRVVVFDVEVAPGAPCADILAAARALGMGAGASSSGPFEVQTDEGIWSPSRGRRLNPRTAVFRTWAELEAAERVA